MPLVDMASVLIRRTTMDDKYYTEGEWYEVDGILKRRHTYFFTSSHERGLEELLVLWPKIKKAIPDAVLHVGYGTYTAATVMKQRRDFEALDEIRGMEQLMYEMDGIEYHQRMNQWELAKVQLQCEAWLYPYQHDEKWGGTGGFPETYCITALEAQAAGAIPVSRSNAALSETIKNRIAWEKDDTYKTIIQKLKHPEKFITKEQIEANKKWAISQSWSSLAKIWLDKLVEKPKEM